MLFHLSERVVPNSSKERNPSDVRDGDADSSMQRRAAKEGPVPRLYDLACMHIHTALMPKCIFFFIRLFD